MKIIICANAAWNLVNFRAGLIRGLVKEGHEVVALAPEDKYACRLAALGCRFVPQAMDNKGTHPGRDLKLLLQMLRTLRRERPDVFMGYTIKPNIYGSLAARCLSIPVVNNITGLGAVFIREGWLMDLVRMLYRTALSKSAKVFFQNVDDRDLFLQRRLVQPDAAEVLPGSGIDLIHYLARDTVVHLESRRKFRFLLVARMLWDKGIREYADAAVKLMARHPNVEFCLLGFLDVQNPQAISREQMDEMVAKGLIYLGVSDDVRVEISGADCVVLPSYREGTPKTLLEAAAMGKPVVTTDAVGCREAVEDQVNGFLCKPGDAGSLEASLERMLLLTPRERHAMGLRGRAKMERQFDEAIVVRKYLMALAAIEAKRPGHVTVTAARDEPAADESAVPKRRRVG